MKRKCRLCAFESSNTIQVREMMYGSDKSFDYLICDNCGSLSLIEIPQNLASYYPEDYYSFMGSENGNFKKWISNKKSANNLGKTSVIGFLVSLVIGKNSNLKAIKICNPNKDTSKILDVGSGGGLFLDKLNEQGFKRIMGIDPFLEGDVVSKDYEIRKMTIKDLVDDKRTFNIIILSHVFEHLEEPINSLKDIYKLLDKDGMLILRTPISSSLAFEKFQNDWFQIDAPRHILIPSFSGLVDTCKQNGFVLEEHFFDSDANQFVVSENYRKGLTLKSQKSNDFSLKYNPKRIYYTLLAKYANYKNNGDQATFVFKKQ